MKRNLPAGRGSVERHLVRLTVWVLAIATAMPGSAWAQNGCVAAVRSLAAQTPRVRLREVSRITHPHRDVIAEGTTCSADSSAMVRRSMPVLGRDVRAGLLWPEARSTFLGSLPDARNAGPMWSGRGATMYGSVGMSLDVGRTHLVVAPAFWWTENRRFDLYTGRDPSRHGFASPWYSADFSLDLPSRHGADAFAAFELGESALWSGWRNIEGGVSTGTQAWGPGLRGHLLLGPDTPGMPRYFIRTGMPYASRYGILSATAFLGTLIESRFFDANPANDTRSLLAWTAAYSPSESSPLTVGITHGSMRSGMFSGAADQMMTLYLQARSPADAARAWVEVGRMGGLPSLRQFLTVPYAGVAYLAGFEYGARFAGGALMVSAEAVNLEQPVDIRGVVPHDFYTSANIGQGWSHRGRPLGVATGPGSQSQWLGFDWIAPRWSAGIFGERVRWNEDAFIREYLAYHNRHDVSLRLGLAAGVVVRNYEVAMELSTGRRLNYLFQNGSYIPGFQTVDVRIPQLRLSFIPVHR